MDNTQELLTIHHALVEAVQEPEREDAMATYTFRIHKDDRAAAEEICQRHGTSLAALLRTCCRVLVREYKQ